jgi:hypothetical protein
MARITDSDVEGVIEVDDSITLTPFITAANELVTELCTDSDYTDARLALIETWLAAHFYAIRDQAVAMDRAGPVQNQYQYKIGLFLHQTKHGQMALTLDTDGNLAALSKRMEEGEAATISISWLGTDYDTEDDE